MIRTQLFSHNPDFEYVICLGSPSCHSRWLRIANTVAYLSTSDRPLIAIENQFRFARYRPICARKAGNCRLAKSLCGCRITPKPLFLRLSPLILGGTTISLWSNLSYCSELHLALNRSVVLRFPLYLESLGLAAGTMNQRLAAVGRLAYEAADSGLLSPELAGKAGPNSLHMPFKVLVGFLMTTVRAEPFRCK